MRRITAFLAITLLLYIVVLSLSYSFLFNLPAYDEKRFLQLALISFILIFSSLSFLPPTQRSYSEICLSKNNIFLLFLILILGFLSSVLSLSPRHAFLEFSTFIGLFYLANFIAILFKQYPTYTIQVLLYATILGSIIYMIGFYAGYVASIFEHIPLKWPEPFFGFSNIRAFNQYQLYTLLFFITPIIRTHFKNKTLYYGIYAMNFAWWALLFYSACRGVLFAVATAGVITLLIYKQAAWRLILLLISVSIGGFILYTSLFLIIPYFLDSQINDFNTAIRTSSSGRLILWKDTWNLILNNPLLGVGPMHFAWYPLKHAHPHNSILQIACEFGIPVALLIIWLAIKSFIFWLRKFNSKTIITIPENDRYMPILLFYTLTASIFYSFFDGVIVMPLSQIMFSIIIGLMIGLYSDAKKIHLRKNYYLLLYSIFATVTLSTLTWSALPDLLPRIMQKNELIFFGYQADGPRFWQAGGIPHDSY